MNNQRILIWTGDGPGDPADGARAKAIPELPPPALLPRGALIVYWWGPTRFEILAPACSVCTTPWGDGQMTWLYCAATQTVDVKGDGPTTTRMVLIPAHYVTTVKPGPTFRVAARQQVAEIGLFPPGHPAPPHALTLAEIERRLAELGEWPTPEGWRFAVRYPLFALRRESGGYVGFNPGAAAPNGAGLGVAVFTSEARAAEFGGRAAPSAQVVAFDRPGRLRRFLRGLRDAGTVVVFDPLTSRDGRLYAEFAFPAAVVLERFLPEPGFIWGYPVYVLRYKTGHACVTGNRDDGTAVKLLAVFTDADLAERAVAAARDPLAAEPVDSAAAFARLVRGLAADVAGVAFDPPDPVRGGVVRHLLFRDKLLASLDDRS